MEVPNCSMNLTSHVPINTNDIFSVSSRPSLIAFKFPQKISNQMGRISGIRKAFYKSSSRSTVRPTSSLQLTLSEELEAFLRSTSKQEIHSTSTNTSSASENLIPISIPEAKSMALDSSLPKAGAQAASVRIPKFGTTFVDVLTQNKCRNRHAPTMVSMLNPLRDKVPSRAWAHLSCNTHGQVPSGSFFLTSPRFKRALSSRFPHPSRSECEWKSNDLSYGKAYWLQKTCAHCRFCKQDSLCTKLLVFSHYQRRAQEILSTQGNICRKNQTTLNNDDLLESPRLLDLDDFGDFDIDDASLFDDISLDGDIDNQSSED